MLDRACLEVMRIQVGACPPFLKSQCLMLDITCHKSLQLLPTYAFSDVSFPRLRNRSVLSKVYLEEEKGEMDTVDHDTLMVKLPSFLKLPLKI